MSDEPRKWFDKTFVPLSTSDIPELPNQRTRVIQLRDLEEPRGSEAFLATHGAALDSLHRYALAIDAPGLAYALIDQAGSIRTLQHIGGAGVRGNSLVVGRHSHVDSPTEATNLALRHTVVTQRSTDGLLEVRDLRSVTGTRLIDGTRLVAAQLQSPCVLDLGEVFLAMSSTPAIRDKGEWLQAMLASRYSTLQLQNAPIGIRLERFIKVPHDSRTTAFRLVDEDERGPVELRLEEMVELTPTPEQITRGFLLGRYGRCDWPAKGDGHPSGLSRVHAMVFQSQGRPYIVDTGSTNGVRHPEMGFIRYKHLALGDQLWLGRTVRLTVVAPKQVDTRTLDA
jgi:hypothetical protein